MSTPLEHDFKEKSTKLLILPSLRTIYNRTFQCEIPCTTLRRRQQFPTLPMAQKQSNAAQSGEITKEARGPSHLRVYIKESKFQCTKSTSVFPMVASFIFGVQRVHFSAVVLLLPFFQKPSSFLVFSVSCSHVKDRTVGTQGVEGERLAEKVENSVQDYPRIESAEGLGRQVQNMT